MHVHVDEAGRDELAGAVERVERAFQLTGGVHARDQRPDQADVGRPQLATTDVDDRAAGQQEIERFASLRGRHRASPDDGIDGIDTHRCPFSLPVSG